ncbi:MAG: serine hydrolase [Clostridiaceae bacterium]|nr:serine hydrolase [Clostridiaceae bacterium]
MSNPITFPEASPESLGIPSTAIERYLDHVRDKNLAINSLMILRHGKLAAAGWWAPYAPDLVHAAHSLTKSFTSTAIGLMIHEGRIGLHDRVADLFPLDMPDHPSENLLKMDLWHLLTMTCGHETEPMPVGSENFTRAFLAHPVVRDPGTHYLYNSLASYMLTVLVYEKTGMNLLDYLRPRVLDPIGIGEVFCLTCPRGIENGGGGMYIRTEDIARMAQLYLQKGRHDGVQLIPEAWIDEASTWQVSTANHPAGDGDHTSGFGYHIWRCIPPDVYRFAGANGQFGIVMPTKDAVAAITSSSWDTAGITEGFWDIVLPSMTDAPLPEDPAAAGRLRDRLSRLRLAWTPARRDPAGESRLEGVEWVWPKNTFRFSLQRGAPSGAGVACTRIVFSGNRATMEYEEEGNNGRLLLGMDGNPVENPYMYAGHTFPVLATGAWTEDGAFVVDMRSILNVAHRKMVMRPDGDRVRIRIESTPNTDGLTNPPPLEFTAAARTGV